MIDGIVGRIVPPLRATLTELSGWTEPYRGIELTDQHGRRHGYVEWLESEVDEDFKVALHNLMIAATRDRRVSVDSPGSPSVVLPLARSQP